VRIRIGNQTNCHHPHIDPYQFALASGFDAFEWFSDRGRHGWCEDDTPTHTRTEWRKAAADGDLRYSVHAPYYADPVTPDGEAMIRTSIRFAADIGAGIVNFHLFPNHPARQYAECVMPLAAESASLGVKLSLENTPETGPDHINAVFGCLSAMPAAVGTVGLCFDMGHANIHPPTRYDYVGYLDAIGDHVPVTHWHAHENWGDRDSHLVLFTGPSAKDDRGLRSLVKRLKRRGFGGSVVLEQWPSPPELLVAARDRLRAMWDEVA
jgi:sugar phosphate isomerase/epimerase